MSSQASSFLQGYVSRLVTLVMTSIFSLATAHLVIRYYGVTAFSVIGLLTGIQIILQFGDLGMSSAIMRASANSESNYSLFSGIVKKSIHVMVIVLTCLCISVIILGYLDFWSFFLGYKKDNITDWAISLSLCLTILSSLAKIPIAILVGEKRVVTVVKMQTVPSLILSLVTLFSVLLDLEFNYYVILSPIGNLLVAILLFTKVKPRGFLSKTKSETKIELWRSAVATLIVSLSLQLILISPRYFLNIEGSQSELVQYLIFFIFFTPLWSVIQAAGASFISIQETNLSKAMWKSLYLDSIRKSFLAAIASMILFFIAVEMLFPIVGQEHTRPDFLQSFCFAVLLLSLASFLPSYYALLSDEGLRFQAKLGLLALIMSLALASRLTSTYGLVGIIALNAVIIFLTISVPCFFRSMVILKSMAD